VLSRNRETRRYKNASPSSANPNIRKGVTLFAIQKPLWIIRPSGKDGCIFMQASLLSSWLARSIALEIIMELSRGKGHYAVFNRPLLEESL